jgi:hypothetical protein
MEIKTYKCDNCGKDIETLNTTKFRGITTKSKDGYCFEFAEIAKSKHHFCSRNCAKELITNLVTNYVNNYPTI